MELIDELIYVVKNDYFSSNSYILKDKLSNSCLIVDPGLDTKALDDKIEHLKLVPIAVLSTHGHFDHIGSVSFFKKKHNIPFYIHAADSRILNSANFFLKILGINHKIIIPVPDFLFTKDEENIKIGNFELSIFNFPGHSAGSCVIQFQNYLFTGDIIYLNGLGLNYFPGENKLNLKKSILKLFEIFNDDFVILPGHGKFDFLHNFKLKNQELSKFLN